MRKENFLPNFRKSLSLYSWALYDFANTIFSAVVLTFYFPLYLTDLTRQNLHLGVSTTFAMVLAGLAVPWLGALSDRTGKTKAYLILTTLLCVAFTMALSFFQSVPFLIGGYLLACFFFQASLVFYYALLPVVAEREKVGWASGLGIAWGYLGVLFAIPIAHLTDTLFGRRFVFIAAGILFFIFSLPLFRGVPERKVEKPSPASWRLFLQEWMEVFKTIRSLSRHSSLLFFFLGSYFVSEALNTIIFWLVIYLSRVFHPPQVTVVGIFLGLNFGAFLWGLLAGFLSDRWGSHKTLLAAATSLLVTLVVLALTKDLGTFIVLAFTGGAFGLAGVGTSARKRVVELAPPQAVGEYFGLYNLTTKISVAGSLIFSILADRFGYQAALLSQAVPSAIGLLFLWLAQKRN